MSCQIGLVQNLSHALETLQENPCPHVPNPPDCQKRASVALLLRIRPTYTDSLSTGSLRQGSERPDQGNAEFPKTLSDLFLQSWVQNGDAEILFIKRAGREGDRWSGHIALPGGGRDPGDEDDKATAIRETREEIGLDLTTDGRGGVSWLFAGNLAERVVTTTFGKKALMVLCPFVFVLTGPVCPPLLLQPTEVAAVHWVPLRCLLAPSLRTRELVDVSSRLGKRASPLTRTALGLTLGKMMFSAILLIPSESHFSPSTTFLDFDDSRQRAASSAPLTLAKRVLTFAFGISSSTSTSPSDQPPLRLWGLTLGIVSDLLDMLPPHNATRLWQYPTFSTPDLRFLIHLLSYKLRKNNARQLSTNTWPSPMTDASVVAAVSEAEPRPQSSITKQPNEADMAGPDLGATQDSSPRKYRTDLLSQMLSQYYDRMNVAITVFLLWRTVALAAGLGYLILVSRRGWSVQGRLWRRIDGFKLKR